MARPVKAGLDYFNLDCCMNDKVKLIEAEFGVKGFAIIVKLYQKIYRERGYYCEWNDDVALLFLSDMGGNSGVDYNLINGIVSASIRRGIFSKQLYDQYGVLTSERIQEQYFEATSRREKVEVEKEYLLVNVNNNSVYVNRNPVNVCRNPVNVCRNAQSKVNKSKEDYIKESSHFAPPTAEEVRAYCSERKNQVNAEKFIDFYSSKGWMIGKNKMKDWKAAVRTWEKRDNPVAKQNRFNDFPQREHDYNSLEEQLLKRQGGL